MQLNCEPSLQKQSDTLRTESTGNVLWREKTLWMWACEASMRGKKKGMAMLLTYVGMIQNLHYSYFSEQLEEKTHGFISCLPIDLGPFRFLVRFLFLSLSLSLPLPTFKTDLPLKETKLKPMERGKENREE